MLRRRVLGLLLVAACTGCGQVGPLHLPEDAPDNESYLLQRKKGKAPPPTPAPVPVPAEAPASSQP